MTTALRVLTLTCLCEHLASLRPRRLWRDRAASLEEFGVPNTARLWRIAAQELERSLATVDAGRLLDVPVYNHVILAGERYVSFAEGGLL